MENVKKNRAAEIYLDGSVCYQTTETFEEVMSKLEILSEDNFIYITRKNGCRAAFRKRNVVSVNQYEEE